MLSFFDFMSVNLAYFKHFTIFFFVPVCFWHFNSVEILVISLLSMKYHNKKRRPTSSLSSIPSSSSKILIICIVKEWKEEIHRNFLILPHCNKVFRLLFPFLLPQTTILAYCWESFVENYRCFWFILLFLNFLNILGMTVFNRFGFIQMKI